MIAAPDLTWIGDSIGCDAAPFVALRVPSGAIEYWPLSDVLACLCRLDDRGRYRVEAALATVKVKLWDWMPAYRPGGNNSAPGADCAENDNSATVADKGAPGAPLSVPKSAVAGNSATVAGLFSADNSVASPQDWSRANAHGGDRSKIQAATLPLASVADRAAQSGASERTQRMADKVSAASDNGSRR